MPESTETTHETNMNVVNVNEIVPVHDAILPYEYEGVIWAVPNLGDNTETENAALAEAFEICNRYLLGMSVQRDCFSSGAPSLACVRRHHNCYVQLLNFIDARTKVDNEDRLDMEHITPNRRKFQIFPVRYFDQKNRFTRRWTELYLYALSSWAQLSKVNTWTNDFHINNAKLMKKLPQEAYRLMAVELFNIPFEVAKDPNFRLKQGDLDTYDTSHIPEIEWVEHPFTAFFTEDRMRPISTHRIEPAPGVESPATGGGHTVMSPGEVHERRANQTL